MDSYFKKCLKCHAFIEKVDSLIVKCECGLFICFECRKDFTNAQTCREHVSKEHGDVKDFEGRMRYYSLF